MNGADIKIPMELKSTVIVEHANHVQTELDLSAGTVQRLFF